MTTPDHVVKQIEDAFAEAPRPTDEELLHEDCGDDTDIQSLYGIAHWRDVPEAIVEGEWAALFFLSPAAFRHFLPAYMSFALHHPDCGAAAVNATIFALTPARDQLRSFTLSKFALFDDIQRAAVLSFLEAMAPFEDVSDALAHWRASQLSC